MEPNALNQTVTENDVQKSVFSDLYSSVIGRQATEEEIAALSQEEKEDIENRHRYIQDYAEQSKLDQQYATKVQNDPNSVFYSNGELNTSLDNLVDDGLGINKDYTYRKAKQAMHDYAKLSSAEQSVVDKVNREKAIERDSTMITPEEARSLGGEYGVELKYDKNVARGEVMFAIGQNLYKQELERNLAKYTSDQDFTVMQNLGMIGSAISGGVGFYETAATVALSFFLPQVAVATAARVGALGKTGFDIAKGAQLAYKTQRVAKLAVKSKNTAKLLQSASNADEAAEVVKALNIYAKTGTKINQQVTTAIENASKTTQLTNKLSNLALQNAGAADAFTLGQRSMLTAADAVASNVPAMIMSGRNSYLNQNQTYTAKNCMIDSLFSAAIGGVIPVAGKAFKYVGAAGTDMFGNLKGHVQKKLDDYRYKKAMEGLSDDNIEKAGKDAQKGLDEAAKGFKQPDPDFTDLALKYKSQVGTEEEVMENFRYVAQKLCNGEVANLSLLPNKSIVMTHVASDIVDSIKKGVSEVAEGVINITKKGLLHTISVKDETGLLGRVNITSYSEAKTKELLSDVYKAVLDNDADAYIRVAAHVENQNALVNDLVDLIQRVDDLKTFNKQNKGKASAIGLDDQEDFKASLAEIVGRLKYGSDYDRIKALQEDDYVNQVLTGLVDAGENKAEIDLINSILAEIMDEASSFGVSKTLKDKRTVFNLDIDKLWELADELDTSSKNLAELLNSDEVLKQRYGSADDLIEAINKGTVYADTDLNQIFGTPRVTSEEFATRLEDLEMQKELSGLAKQQWEAAQTAENFAEIDHVFRLRDEAIRRTNKDNTGDTYFTKSRNLVASIDEFLTNGLPEMKNNLSNIFNTEEFQKFLNTALLRGGEGTRKAILKGNSSIIRSLIDTHVGEPLKKIGVELSESDIVDLADRFTKVLESGKAQSLQFEDGAKIIDNTLPEEEMLKRAEQGMQKSAVVDELIDPLLVEVQRLALNKQFQHLNTLNLTTKYAGELMKNPFIPGEVITKIFTFSPYNLDGSNMNIENIVRNSQAFVRDIEAELRRKSPGTTATEKMLTGGVDLVEYMHNPANRKGINAALVYMDWYGSADAAKKAGVPFNSDDAVIAQVIRDRYATMLNNLANVGSMKQKVGNRLNLTKLRHADRFIPDTEIEDIQKCINDVLSIQADKGSVLGKNIAKFQNAYGKLTKHDINKTKVALFAIKHFDLDKMFNGRGTAKTNLNDVRDALLTGKFTSLAKTDIQKLTTFVDAFDNIANSLTGKPHKLLKNGESEFKVGWVNSYVYKTERFDKIKHNLSNKYVDNFNDGIIFKDVESELKSMDLLGYDSVVDQMNHDFETGQRAYAVLKMAGSEPIKLAEDLLDFHDSFRYLHQNDIFEHGTKQADASRVSDTIRHSVLANAAMAAGVDYVASRTSTRILKAVADLFSSPLLVNAGFRSLTDYSYQQEWMILNGLMESKNLLGWTKGINSTSIMFRDKELQRLVCYNQFMTQDHLLRLRTNVDTDSLGEGTKRFSSVQEMWKALSDGKGTGVDKLERFAKAYSTLMINDIGMVDKFTNIHRSSAALTIMRSISAFADKSFDGMNDGLRNLLKRHDIDAADWDFLRTHCNIEFNDYLLKKGISNANLEKDFALFIPDNLLDVPDDVFKKAMKAKGFNPDNKIAFDNFRNDMYEKASILINSSADEMTTLPTYRTTNAMSLGVNPSSGLGQFLGAITKFQSFGMACTQIHFGRRLAQYCDTEDTANVQTIYRLLTGRSGLEKFSKGMGSLAHLMIATSMAQLMIDEALDAAKGQTQGFTDNKGRFNLPKVVDPIIASTGIFSPFLDATAGKLAQGNSLTSGFLIQAMPAANAMWRDVEKLAIKPWFDRDADAGEKFKRFGAAFANVLAQKMAISNYALTSLVWRHAVGGWLEEQERGAKKYNRYIKSKRREGHTTDTWYSRYQTDPTLFGF